MLARISKLSNSLLLPLAGFFVISLFFSVETEDANLIPRYFALSLYLVLIALVSLVRARTFSILITPMVWSYLGFIIWSLIAISWAFNSPLALMTSSKYVLGFLVFMVTNTLLEEKQFSRQFSWIKMNWIVVGFILVTIVLGLLIFDQNGESFAGLSSNKNLYSSLLFLLLPFLIVGVFINVGFSRVISVLLVLIAVGIMAFNRTRSVYVGLLFTGVLMVSFFGVKRFRSTTIFLLIGTSLLTCLGLFFLPEIIEVLELRFGEDAWSALIRLETWQKSMSLFLEHPILGVGPGNWKTMFPLFWGEGLYQTDMQRIVLLTPHNDWLQLLFETGIVGLVLYLGFYLGIIILSYRRIKDMRPTENWQVKLLWCFMAGFMLVSFFDFPMQRIEHSIFTSISLALLHSEVRLARIKSFRIPTSTALTMAFLMGATFICYTGYAYLDGEKRMKVVYKLKKSDDKNYQAVLRQLESVDQRLYNSDSYGIPVDWYVGNAQASQGNFSAALSLFEHAYQIHPNQIKVLGDLATAYSVNGNNSKAYDLYRKAIKIYAGYDDGLRNIAVMHLNDNKLDSAIHYMKRISIVAKESIANEVLSAPKLPVYTLAVKQMFAETIFSGDDAKKLKQELGERYFEQGNLNESRFWYLQMIDPPYAAIKDLRIIAQRLKEEGRKAEMNEVMEKIRTATPVKNRLRILIADICFEFDDEVYAMKMLAELEEPMRGTDLIALEELSNKLGFSDQEFYKK